jgi:hypothetical protein
MGFDYSHLNSHLYDLPGHWQAPGARLTFNRDRV